MSIDTLRNIIDYAMLYPLMIAFFVLSLFQKMAVPGSHKKYVFTSLGIVTSALIVCLFLLKTALYLNGNDFFSAGIETILALVYTWLGKRHFGNDDNWFNNQFKKFKQKLRRLGKRLSQIRISFPSPLPSPA